MGVSLLALAFLTGFVSGESLTAVMTVSDEDGGPVAGIAFRTFMADGPEGWYLLRPELLEQDGPLTDADGRAVVALNAPEGLTNLRGSLARGDKRLTAVALTRDGEDGTFFGEATVRLGRPSRALWVETVPLDGAPAAGTAAVLSRIADRGFEDGERVAVEVPDVAVRGSRELSFALVAGEAGRRQFSDVLTWKPPTEAAADPFEAEYGEPVLLQGGWRFRGRLSDEVSRPVSGHVSVAAFPAEGNGILYRRSGPLDADGRFEVEDLPRGWNLQVHGLIWAGERTGPPTHWVPRMSPEQAREVYESLGVGSPQPNPNQDFPIVLTPEEWSEEVTLPVEQTGTAEVVLLDGGEPLADTEIWLNPETPFPNTDAVLLGLPHFPGAPPVRWSGVTDASGVAVIRGLPPTRLHLSGIAPPDLRDSDFVLNGASFGRDGAVEPGGRSRIRFTLR